MKAVTLPQPHASLVAAGVQTIVTLPRPTDWRGDLLIHAGARAPVMGDEIGATGWYWEWDVDEGIVTNGHTLVRHPAPLGAVVAVARVTDCVPIVKSGHVHPYVLTTGEGAALVVSDQTLWGRQVNGWIDRTDQLPYADFTPGRWALLLDDVRPLPEPVPAKGRPGVWTPDSALLAEDAT